MIPKLNTRRGRKRLCVETIPPFVLLGIYVFFFFLFGALMMTSIFGPDAYETVTSEDEYTSGFLNATEYLEGEIHRLRPWNFELYFYLRLFPKKDIISQTGFSKILTYQSVKIMSSNGDEQYKIRNSLSKSVTRKVVCEQEHEVCDVQLIFHEMSIKYENYKVLVLLSDDDPYPKELFQNRVEFSFTKGKSDFAIYEISYRYGFLGLNFFVFFMYLLILCCRQSAREIHIEQYWTLILLFSLSFFNNPLYIFNFVLNWWFFMVLNMLFKVLFICVFLLCLLVFAHALYATREETNSVCGFYFWKFCVFASIYIVSSLSLTYSAFHQNEDPSYIISQSITFFEQVKYGVVIILGVYTCNLAYYIARAFSIVDRMKRGKGWKLKIVFFTTVFIVGSTLIAYFAFSYFNIVKDSIIFVLYQYFFNGYVFLLAIFYLPSNQDEVKDRFSVIRSLDDDARNNNVDII